MIHPADRLTALARSHEWVAPAKLARPAETHSQAHEPPGFGDFDSFGGGVAPDAEADPLTLEHGPKPLPTQIAGLFPSSTRERDPTHLGWDKPDFDAGRSVT